MYPKMAIVLCLLFHCLSSLANEPQKVASKIKKVTVFLKGAQVTRSGLAVLPVGKSQLIFEKISPDIDVNSIQVEGDGDFTILSVQHQLNYLNQQEDSQAIITIKKEQKKLQDKLAIAKNLKQVFEAEKAVILSNRKLGSEASGVSAAELRQGVEFFRVRLSDISQQLINNQKDIAKYTENLQQYTNQLKAWEIKKNKATSEIIVTLAAETNTAAEFFLSYLVKDAAWYPTYDVRVKDVKSPIALQYKANVYQQSGENWEEVKLTLSTGNPMGSGNKPLLQPIKYSSKKITKTRRKKAKRKNNTVSRSSTISTFNYRGTQQKQPSVITGKIIDADTNEPLPFANIALFDKDGKVLAGTNTDFDGYYKLENVPISAVTIEASFIGYQSIKASISSNVIDFSLSEETERLEEVTIVEYSNKFDITEDNITLSVEELELLNILYQNEKSDRSVTTYEVTNLTYQVTAPYTIPSNRKNYVVDIKNDSLPATYQYSAVPKIDETAFLIAQVPNWENYNLLDGSMNLFFEGKYLGQATLQVNEISDTLTLSLGRDKDIVIKREKNKAFSSSKFIGTNRKEARAWQISVRNKKTVPIQLTIEDQIPISANKAITIEKVDVDKGQLDKKKGLVKWTMNLQPADSKLILLKYTVKYPRNKRANIE